jgi:hypothetical protein
MLGGESGAAPTSAQRPVCMNRANGPRGPAFARSFTDLREVHLGSTRTISSMLILLTQFPKSCRYPTPYRLF